MTKLGSKETIMKRVILESPYAANGEANRTIDDNLEYAAACMRDSLERGEAPFASHLLYTRKGILRDEDVEERRWGINAGLRWGAMAEATVVYIDHGVSSGMQHGVVDAVEQGRRVEFRSIDKDKDISLREVRLRGQKVFVLLDVNGKSFTYEFASKE